MNRDQREVLLHMGVDDVLLDEIGWTRLMQSMRGGCGPRGDRPEHSVARYDCRAGKITAEFHDGTQVVITRAVMNKYRKTLEPELVEGLKAVRLARQAENRRVEKWCHCPNPEECVRRNAGDPLYGGRHHPSDAEDEEHLRTVWAIRDQEKEALRAALHLLPEPQPGEQLDLFA